MSMKKIQSFLQKGKFIIYPLIAISFGGLLFYYLPKFIPDYLGISNYSKIYELFNLIISALVSLIGIYVTVSLVAYELFKQKSGIDFHKSFLQNTTNAYFISFSVITIIFVFFSSIIITCNKPSDQEISVIYLNIWLFSSVIVALIPVSFNLFSSFKPEKIAFDEINKIDSNSIFIEPNDIDIENQAEYYENDNLSKVENIVIALIAISDSIKSQLIIQQATLKLSELIIEEKEIERKEYITKRLIDFHISIIDFSITQPNKSNILKSIWLAINNMYTNLIDKKETSIHFTKYREVFFKRFFNRLFENNKEEVIMYGIETIKNIIENQVLFNMPNDNEIIDLHHLRAEVEKDFKYPDNYSKEDYKISNHWREVANEMISCFTHIINKSIYYNKPNLLNFCFNEINNLNYKFYSEKIGKYKECFFYIRYSNIITDYTFTAFDKNVFQEGSDAEHLLPILFSELIIEERLASRKVLENYCYLLIKLQRIYKLDRWFLGGLSIGNIIITEGDLGEIVRRCSYKYNTNVLVQNCLQDCINTYSILKEYYEKNPKNDFHLYMLIKERLTTILDILQKEKINNNKLISNLKKTIKSFIKKEDYLKV